MAKPTTNNQEQVFIYQLGQDVAKLGIEIEQLRNKTGKALRVIVPAKPDKYSNYELPATVELPKEYQNAICIKTTDDNVELIKTTNALTLSTTSVEQVVFIAPIYRLEEDDVQAAFDAERMSLIDAGIEREERERKEQQERAERERKEQQEREERERKEQQERAERERKEQQERAERERKEQQERAERDKVIYKYLAKWLTDNYLDAVRAKGKIDDLETHNIRIYVNKNGLDALLDKPFERNSVFPNYNNVEESIYADVKSAMQAEKARIDRGEVDLSTASDFELVDYNYINHLS